ncbi:MAG TPA: PadR family transcriptional regulator [bacterium]|nr:PadR family transcriptional regulator [bacterium]
MERGALRYLVLETLQDGPKHGYEIIKQLEARTHGMYSPSPGIVYPTLQLLEDLRWVRWEQMEERRVYQLTEAGKAELEAKAQHVAAIWERFSGREPSAQGWHEMGFLRDDLHDLMRTIRRAIRSALHSGDHERVRRVRLALERCQNEVRDIIAAEAPAGQQDAPQPPR